MLPDTPPDGISDFLVTLAAWAIIGLAAIGFGTLLFAIKLVVAS